MYEREQPGPDRPDRRGRSCGRHCLGEPRAELCFRALCAFEDVVVDCGGVAWHEKILDQLVGIAVRCCPHEMPLQGLLLNDRLAERDPQSPVGYGEGGDVPGDGVALGLPLPEAPVPEEPKQKLLEDLDMARRWEDIHEMAGMAMVRMTVARSRSEKPLLAAKASLVHIRRKRRFQLASPKGTVQTWTLRYCVVYPCCRMPW